ARSPATPTDSRPSASSTRRAFGPWTSWRQTAPENVRHRRTAMAAPAICSSDRRPLIVARRALPLLHAFADHFHRRHRGVAEAGVAGDLAADTLAFPAKHLAHGLQFGDDAVDLLH